MTANNEKVLIFKFSRTKTGSPLFGIVILNFNIHRSKKPSKNIKKYDIYDKLYIKLINSTNLDRIVFIINIFQNNIQIPIVLLFFTH